MDNIPLAISTVNKVTTKSKSVTGKSEAGATVYVYSGKKKLGSVKVGTNGTFSVKIAAQKKGTSLTVYALDSAGNNSASKVVKVQ